MRTGEAGFWNRSVGCQTHLRPLSRGGCGHQGGVQSAAQRRGNAGRCPQPRVDGGVEDRLDLRDIIAQVASRRALRDVGMPPALDGERATPPMQAVPGGQAAYFRIGRRVLDPFRRREHAERHEIELSRRAAVREHGRELCAEDKPTPRFGIEDRNEAEVIDREFEPSAFAMPGCEREVALQMLHAIRPPAAIGQMRDLAVGKRRPALSRHRECRQNIGAIVDPGLRGKYQIRGSQGLAIEDIFRQQISGGPAAIANCSSRQRPAARAPPRNAAAIAARSSGVVARPAAPTEHGAPFPAHRFPPSAGGHARQVTPMGAGKKA
ncbi:MAG: hypothetical protein WDN08_14070 [Rhizomicrobium sp.]